jgi:5'-AMP-activated protein kinase, catalytic alpha subunit
MSEGRDSNQESPSALEHKQVGKYKLGKTIGQGTFNTVAIARHSITNEQVAVKIIRKADITTPADQLRLKKELKILRKARHPNIVQLYEILEDHHHYYLVTEHASRG